METIRTSDLSPRGDMSNVICVPLCFLSHKPWPNPETLMLQILTPVNLTPRWVSYSTASAVSARRNEMPPWHEIGDVGRLSNSTCPLAPSKSDSLPKNDKTYAGRPRSIEGFQPSRTRRKAPAAMMPHVTPSAGAITPRRCCSSRLSRLAGFRATPPARRRDVPAAPAMPPR